MPQQQLDEHFEKLNIIDEKLDELRKRLKGLGLDEKGIHGLFEAPEAGMF